MSKKVKETPKSKTPAKGAANDLRAAAGVEDVEETSPSASKLKIAASDKAQQAKVFATEKVAVAKEFAAEKAAVAKEKAAERWDASRAKAKDLHAHSEEYIQANPTQAVLGAFGIGVVIGLILRGK